MLDYSVILVPLLLLLLARYIVYSKRSGQALRFPPGPKPLPIIGNILDIPYETPWVVYRDWSYTFGQYPCLFSVLYAN